MSLAVMAVTGLIELNPGCTMREPVTTTSCRAAVRGAAVAGAAAAATGAGGLVEGAGVAWSAGAAMAGSATEAAAALASASRMARLRRVFFDIRLLPELVDWLWMPRPAFRL